ncbi:MAG: AAA family ATPase, partial [Verrucomicrobia bacterium]
MPVIVIVFGVSGAGKTTIGKLLAQEFGWRFYEADDFHSPANIEKM